MRILLTNNDKKILILFFLIFFLSSCVDSATSFVLGFLDRNNKVEKGSQHYQYKCKKVGECCKRGDGDNSSN